MVRAVSTVTSPRGRGLPFVVFTALSAAGVLVAARGLMVGDEWGRVLLLWGAGAAVLFAVPLALGRETRTNLMLSLVMVALMLFVFNAFLVLRGPAYEGLVRAAEAERAKTPGYDTRSPFQFSKDETDAGRPTVPYLTGRIARRVAKDEEVMPLMGVASATTALCNEHGPYLKYYADEYGFRNPPGLHDQADVIVLGDSFAHGECVPVGDSSVEVLRKSGHDVVSLGVTGVGPLVELAVLREYGLRLQPKVVVWYFFEENDLEDLREEWVVPRLRRYLEEDDFTQRLTERQPEVDAFWRKFLGDVRPSMLTDDRGTKVGAYLSLRPLRNMVGLNRTAHWPWRSELGPTLARAKALAEKQGAALRVVYLPGWSRYGGQGALDKAEMLAFFRELGVETVDFDEALRASGDPLQYFPFRMIGHYNSAGHALLARTVETRVLAPLGR